MRKYLLPDGVNYYRANLHSHTTLSDGRMTPEQAKAAYKAEGYSVLALTDHERLVDHSAMNDEDFLMLTGYEVSFDGKEGVVKPEDAEKTCHVNFFARDAHNENKVAVRGNADGVRPYACAAVNEWVRAAKAQGFIAQYNHPAWSLEDLSNYGGYEGFFAVELFNTGCVVEGFEEYNELCYEQMLRRGRWLYAVATDDNHNGYYADSFGGYTMIGAPALTYEAVFDALEKGDFYASTGPRIEKLWVEDGKAHIVCTPAWVSMRTRNRRAARSLAPVTAFECDVRESDGYIRFTLQDERGQKAWTRAYATTEC